MNLETLRRYKPDILKIVEQHKAENVRVFGSVVRGDERPDSDVDILVHFKPGASLWDLTALDRELRELLHMKIDVISDRSIRPELEPFILGEATPL